MLLSAIEGCWLRSQLPLFNGSRPSRRRNEACICRDNIELSANNSTIGHQSVEEPAAIASQIPPDTSCSMLLSGGPYVITWCDGDCIQTTPSDTANCKSDVATHRALPSSFAPDKRICQHGTASSWQAVHRVEYHLVLDW